MKRSERNSLVSGEIVNAYPAWAKYRGFLEKNNTAGYIKVSKFMKENADVLLEESEE